MFGKILVILVLIYNIIILVNGIINKYILDIFKIKNIIKCNISKV